MDRRRVAAVVVVLALVALAGCDGRPPQTEVVCDGCVTGLDEAAPDVTVEDSVTHIYLRESGDADVEARLRLSGNVDELRVNETRRRGIAEEISGGSADRDDYDDLTRPAFPREDLAVETDGETLVVTYRYPNFSDRRLGGTTFSSRFYRLDGRRDDETDYTEPIEFETDRLVVHGPEGTRTMVAPPDATDRGDRLVWTDGTVDTRTYLVFGTGGRLLGRLVAAADVFGWATGSSLFAAFVPAVGLFFQSGLFAAYYPRRLDGEGWDPGSDRLFWVFVGVELAALAFVAGWLFLDVLVGFVATVATAGAVVLAYALVSSEDGDDSPETESVGPGEPRGRREAPPTADRADPGPASGQDGGTADGSDSTADRNNSLFDRFAGRVVGAALPLGAVAVLTVAVAVDYTGSYGGLVAVAAGFVPLFAFLVLGYLVTTGYGGARLATVTGAATAPWLVSFGLVVSDGADDPIALLATFAWWPLVGAVGLLAFYAVLWLATR